MRAGTLRRRLVIQSRSTSQDTAGEAVATWTTVATVWADIAPISGRELVTAQAISAEISHQITLRYQAALANTKAMAGMRAVYGGRNFNIHAVMNEDERNRMLTLLASEGLNDG